MQLPVIWESRRRSGVEICSKYESHRVWIEVRDLSAETSRIDVRVKWPTGDKEDARRILDVIMAAFDEVWKTIRDHYYDPSFNGIDWNAVRDRYRSWAEAAQSDGDLYAALKEMTRATPASAVPNPPPAPAACALSAEAAMCTGNLRAKRRQYGAGESHVQENTEPPRGAWPVEEERP